MTLGQFYEKIRNEKEWTFIQNKISKMYPPGVTEEFQRSLSVVIGEAFHAGAETKTVGAKPTIPTVQTPSSSAPPTSSPPNPQPIETPPDPSEASI